MPSSSQWEAFECRRKSKGLDFLRHTTATLAITAGADISSVKAVLGHGSVVSTEVYAKVNLEKKIEAVSLMDGVFG